MSDFNPYRPPSSSTVAEAMPGTRGLRWFYQLPNLLYTGFVVLSTFGLVIMKPDMFLEAIAIPALLIIYAPILCFLLVRWGTPRLVRFCLWLQGGVVLWVIYLLIDSLRDHSEDVLGGSIYLGINLFALFGGLLQARARSLPKEFIDERP
ncbi:hypothetical protein [Phytopseudomonas straminea]|uniref:Uncharacterized protein n=1 Tax=Pseudomonas straminea TaxID=47882 RepID=A0A1I1WSZ3_PSEOC|nr:hypothetical protein [Pseudomonas straminea]SFD97498.1 hypothetical protein SAMN05216372_106147 [Pseudomonas straminea]